MKTIGRNDSCHCGSGKKYKKCCMDKDMEQSLLNSNEPIRKSITNWEPEEEENDLVLLDEDSDSAEGDFQEADFEEEAAEAKSDRLSSQPYPIISLEEEKLVDAWWDTYKRLESPDDIRNHLHVFMDVSPHLVENLELENEMLFELGADYRQEGRPEDYIQLLLKIRKEFPATYRRSAGFYDLDIIAWLISNNRVNEIEQYLNYFTDYPIDFIDQLFELVHLLMATDNTTLLPEFILKISNRVTSSPDVIGADDILTPLMIHTLSGYLREDYSEKDISRFNEDFSRVAPYELAEPDVPFWKNRFENIFKPYESWPEVIPSKKSQLTSYYLDRGWNFMRYLHESIGISWISAKYYSGLVIEYLIEYLEEKKGMVKQPFDFSKDRIDGIVASLATNFIFLNCTKTMSILNAIWYFAEYLQRCGGLDERQKSIIQTSCTELYNVTLPNLKMQDTEALCFITFPLWKIKNEPGGKEL
jgi:hypothetical protein